MGMVARSESSDVSSVDWSETCEGDGETLAVPVGDPSDFGYELVRPGVGCWLACMVG